MEPKKLKGELVRTAVNINTTHEITKVDLGSKGQTKDLYRKRHLSEPYSKRNGLKRGYI